MNYWFYILVWLNSFSVSLSLSNNGEIQNVASQVNLPVTLLIKDHINLSGYKISLSDLVECKGYQKICDEIYGVQIGDMPPPGQTKSISTKQLTSLVKLEWPNAVVSIVGPSQITLKSTPNIINRMVVNNALGSSVKDVLAENVKFRISIVSMHMNNEIKTLSQNYTLKFPDLEMIRKNDLNLIGSKLAGSPNLRVEVYPSELGGNVLSEEFRVMVKFNIEVLLPLAKSDLKKNSIIDPFDFEYKWFSLSNTRNKFETDVARIQGRTLKKDLRIGEPIPSGGYKVAESVKRGDILQLHMVKNGINIQGKVRVLRQGANGDVVEAEYLETKKKIQVEIIDSLNAKYRF